MKQPAATMPSGITRLKEHKPALPNQATGNSKAKSQGKKKQTAKPQPATKAQAKRRRTGQKDTKAQDTNNGIEDEPGDVPSASCQ